MQDAIAVRPENVVVPDAPETYVPVPDAMHEKIDEILASVRALEARGGPLSDDMCATIRQITEEIPESHGVPFLDDAVREIVAALKNESERAKDAECKVENLATAVTTLGRSLSDANREVAAKHAQWQACMASCKQERDRRQALEQAIGDMLTDLDTATSLAILNPSDPWQILAAVRGTLREIHEHLPKETP